jgi:hypothetical protein
MYDVVMFEPILLKEIVGYAVCATKKYHVSAPGVPLQVLATAGLEMVAEAKVPAVFTHVVPDVNDVAAEHASLEGGGGGGAG